MKELKTQMNKGIVAILINTIYKKSLPINIKIGKTVCVDQSIAGYDNKQYLQDVTVYYEEENEDIFNKELNLAVIQYSQS